METEKKKQKRHPYGSNSDQKYSKVTSEFRHIYFDIIPQKKRVELRAAFCDYFDIVDSTFTKKLSENKKCMVKPMEVQYLIAYAQGKPWVKTPKPPTN